MDIGIGVPSSADSWKIVQRAEELGFTHAWFYDTQQLCADVFVSMAAAAMKTSRIRLGTGVLIPTNRIASVTANAFASLNKLAPGRIDFGVGTGFTGRRTMGLGAMKLADMEDYIDVVYGMLAEETVEMQFEGAPRKVRFLNPELDLINTKDPVALHISAFGKRSRAIAAKRKAAWINIVFTERTGVNDIQRMQKSWTDEGNAVGDLYSTMLLMGRVLDDGEAYDSPEAMAEAGPAAAVYLHSLVENEVEFGIRADLPPEHRQAVDRYREFYEKYQPADARYLTLHRGHVMFVRDDERPLITGDLIRQKSFTGTRDDLIERLTRLKQVGYSQMSIQFMPGHEAAIERWKPVLDAVAAA
jgi:5,10-methylenetetrahydromethanopterin reductase